MYITYIMQADELFLIGILFDFHFTDTFSYSYLGVVLHPQYYRRLIF